MDKLSDEAAQRLKEILDRAKEASRKGDSKARQAPDYLRKGRKE